MGFLPLIKIKVLENSFGWFWTERFSRKYLIFKLFDFRVNSRTLRKICGGFSFVCVCGCDRTLSSGKDAVLHIVTRYRARLLTALYEFHLATRGFRFQVCSCREHKVCLLNPPSKEVLPTSLVCSYTAPSSYRITKIKYDILLERCIVKLKGTFLPLVLLTLAQP